MKQSQLLGSRTLNNTFPEACFFDVDGTLIDSMGLKSDALVHVFRDAPSMSDRIRSYHFTNPGVNRRDKIGTLFTEAFGKAPSKPEIDERVRQFAEYVAQGIGNVPEVEGASELLSSWFRSVRMFAFSAMPEDELRILLEDRGWARSLEDVSGWPTNKAAALEYWLRSKRLRPRRCLVVGDSMADHDVANIGNVPFALVRGTGGPFISTTPPDYVVSDLRQLLNNQT